MKTTPSKRKVTSRRAARRVSSSAGPANPQLIEDLVAANHILADHGVLDGYGHVSARHDQDPNRYLLSRSLAPALVTADDIMEYDLNSNPVNAQGRTLYVERFIHGEIYQARPDVQAVVHNHSPAVIPFGVSTAPLRPLYHMAAFLWEGVPVFEIRDVAGMTDMLVRSPALGRALAQTLGSKAAALMRGHGAVVVSSSLSGVVGRSIYLQLNAHLQAQAIALGEPVTYLDPEEGRRADLGGYQRAWELWKREVMAKR
jgi:HCOMODA/2-hydroxy-3-carboxy-muconic semialdehyde decarboxylase